jgi:hypothetical protein
MILPFEVIRAEAARFNKRELTVLEKYQNSYQVAYLAQNLLLLAQVNGQIDELVDQNPDEPRHDLILKKTSLEASRAIYVANIQFYLEVLAELGGVTADEIWLSQSLADFETSSEKVAITEDGETLNADETLLYDYWNDSYGRRFPSNRADFYQELEKIRQVCIFLSDLFSAQGIQIESIKDKDYWQHAAIIDGLASLNLTAADLAPANSSVDQESLAFLLAFRHSLIGGNGVHYSSFLPLVTELLHGSHQPQTNIDIIIAEYVGRITAVNNRVAEVETTPIFYKLVPNVNKLTETEYKQSLLNLLEWSKTQLINQASALHPPLVIKAEAKYPNAFLNVLTNGDMVRFERFVLKFLQPESSIHLGGEWSYYQVITIIVFLEYQKINWPGSNPKVQATFVTDLYELAQTLD